MRNQIILKTSFILVVFLFLFTTCKKEYAAEKMSADAYNYIYAHTAGTISKADPIRIRFTEDAVAEEAINSEVNASVLHFKPKMRGKAIWENRRTILFQPDNTWTSGTNYVADLHLKKLFNDVPATASTVEFDFRIIEMAFDVQLKGLNAIDTKNLEKQELEGRITFSDLVEDASAEKLVTAKQGNRNLDVRWNHGGAKNTSTFYVQDIRRKATEDDVVQVFWNGKSLGVDTKKDASYTVPALNNFKVMNAEAVHGKDQHFSLHFSDPLLKSQNLDGLVTINNYTGDIRFVVDGNVLKVYPSTRLVGPQKLIARNGIRNTNDLKMRNQSEWELTLQEVNPAVRLVGNGVIMPNSDGLIFPFESVSLNAVDVEVFKIFDNNILHFLQTNNLDGYSQLERVGRIVMQQKISLKDLDPAARFFEWRRYALDLSKLIDADPNAIYQVRIGFRPKYSTYYCDQASNDAENRNLDEDEYYEEDYYGEDYYDEDNYSGDTKAGEFTSIWGGYYGIDGYYDGYSWRHKEDPCYPAYFNYRNFVRSNVIASDLGLIAKEGADGSMFIAVTDLKTTEPIIGTDLDFFDYQNQLLKSVKTDTEGTARVDLDSKAFVVVAKKGLQKGYLKLGDGNSLSLSKFDVAGATSQKGLKGFIYGERGVWRPGDSIYLNFVLEDKSNKLPSNYPVAFEFYDPRGQLQQKTISSNNVSGLYALTCKTDSEDPTGNWVAKVKAGGATFSKTIKVETVKPNRLKINLDFGEGDLMAQTDGTVQGNLDVKWLHGAPAKNLESKVEVQLKDTRTKFENYEEFVFDDPSRKIGRVDPNTIFEAAVDANGQALVSTKLSNGYAPGKLRANFKVRAFETGGDVSVNSFSKNFSPYKAYAGVNIPKNRYGQRRLEVEQPSSVELVSLDAEGNLRKGKALNVGLYRVDWRWWWDRGNDNIARYNTAEHTGAIQKEKLVTQSDGKANWDLTVEKWGRYLVRVCDDETGHCAGSFFYAGSPWNEGSTNREQASILAFSSDKERYNVGETIELQIPTGEAGRALISIESGSKVVETHWMEAKKGENTFRFYATAEMTPTVYANVSLIQPHAQVENDLPIRMYGVVPIKVEDPKTKLKPIIAMPEVLEPEQKVTVKVREENGAPMAYTIAMVDDGLLDLTNFKTPNPWNTFYAREALGVKTWDLYDQVLGAYGGELERVLSIGGDGEAGGSKEGQKANRFKPVVKHIGPFFLEKGSSATHEIEVPNYVGSVRTMVVAAHNGAYGSVANTTPVRKPLMVLATLPRVIGPGESLTLPVNIFAMEKKVKDVTITVEESSGLVNFLGGNRETISFTRPDDKIVNFNLQIGEQVGIAKFKITAQGAGEIATQEIEIDVRNPNPYIVDVKKAVLEAGKEWTTDFAPAGMEGTNEGTLEVSNLPPIDLGNRMKYLLEYPYGCLEQTTSKGFPLLYVDRLIELDAKQKAEVPKIVQATVDRLKRFQTSSGGFSYWPGQNYYNGWASNYAGHFLVEAKNLGYNVSDILLSKYTKYQRNLARKWDPELDNLGFYRYNSDLEQAYRLYVLALAQKPEYGAMNRMREMDKLSNTCRWRLAAAYAVSGKEEVARDIISKLSRDVKEYSEMSYTFGSSLRDRAMIVETLTILNDKKAAMELIEIMSDQISADRWWSTQSLAYSFMSIGKFVGNNPLSSEFNFAYQVGDGKVVNAGSKDPFMQIEIPIDGTNNRSVKVTNMSGGMLFTRVILTGQPLVGDQTAAESHLKMAVQYKDMSGNPINPRSIEQGTDFIAEVELGNPGTKGKDYKEMALTQIFPSGWEIINSRLDNLSFAAVNDKANQYVYQDIRDDRVNTFFNVRQNGKRTYRIQLNAAYQGRFYMPTTACQAMYDNTISARKPGDWVEVTQPVVN